MMVAPAAARNNAEGGIDESRSDVSR